MVSGVLQNLEQGPAPTQEERKSTNVHNILIKSVARWRAEGFVKIADRGKEIFKTWRLAEQDFPTKKENSENTNNNLPSSSSLFRGPGSSGALSDEEYDEGLDGRPYKPPENSFDPKEAVNSVDSDSAASSAFEWASVSSENSDIYGDVDEYRDDHSAYQLTNRRGNVMAEEGWSNLGAIDEMADDVRYSEELKEFCVLVK